jgi:hypothetical protein
MDLLSWICSREREGLLGRNGRMGGTRIRGGRGLLSLLLLLLLAVVVVLGVNDVRVNRGMTGGHG